MEVLTFGVEVLVVVVLDWLADFMVAPAADLEPEAARTIVGSP